MSCRKFSAPRHGSLAYCPKRRTKSLKQSIKTVPNKTTKSTSLLGFFAYKCGMTHVVSISERQARLEKKKETKREIVNAVTILEAPPINVIGIVAYKKTMKGYIKIGTKYSNEVPYNVQKRLTLKNRISIQKKSKNKQKSSEDDFLKNADILKLIVSTNPPKPTKTKKAHISELQVTGENAEENLKFCLEKLGGKIKLSDVFEENELIDTIGTTKGHGFTGTPKRFGTTILSRKARKGRRKVACIGAWHPAGVLRTVARAGNFGFFRRTEFNKKIYKIANGSETFQTDYDLTEKKITPIGGFPRYGEVENDYLMIKGCITGCPKRIVTLRKSLKPSRKVRVNENTTIKFIDTSSKFGHGRFQTTEEKKRFYGLLKAEIEN